MLKYFRLRRWRKALYVGCDVIVKHRDLPGYKASVRIKPVDGRATVYSQLFNYENLKVKYLFPCK